MQMQLKDKAIEVRRISIIDEKVIAELLSKCHDYFQMVSGRKPNQEDISDFFNSLPPNKTLDEKCSLGLYQNNKLEGVVDIILGYPEPTIAYLGLLLINPKQRGHGLGKQIHSMLSEWLENNGITTIRLGVLESNHRAIRFWEQIGYVLEDEKFTVIGGVKHRVLIFSLLFTKN